MDSILETVEKIISSDVVTTTIARSVATVVLGALSVFTAAQWIYRLYFHPLANFPGPRIAAVSNVWYAYHWLSGRYPWAVENALRKYGEVVRIAPNELVFMNPQAFADIYTPHNKGLELFVKTDFQNRGTDFGGIVWEEDPVRHREVARRLAPAFSSRTVRTLEPVLHRHMDYFVERMREKGAAPEGVPLVKWMHWLAFDLSADRGWSEEAGCMRNEKNSIYLDVLLGFNAFATVIQVFKRFPWISPLKYLFVPLAKLSSLAAMERNVKARVLRRIDLRGKTEHPDLFDFVLPADAPAPRTQTELYRLGSIAMQLVGAGFGPMSDWYYGVFFYLTAHPESYALAVEEIRAAFNRYEDITAAAAAQLPFLHACLEETLRLLSNNSTGLPRYSPGTVVAGNYIPKGTTVQTSIFAFARSPQYWHDALAFRPQRWLPTVHPSYDPIFDTDERRGLHPFSLGPRACPGREMAWTEACMFVAKVLWSFDVRRVGVAGGLDVDVEGLERKLLHYGFLVKPEVRVRFVQVQRGERVSREGVS